ncbi:hypothetical protein RHMOL_Rhmol10G0302400 [Rhododendron molle]|uniref:Uncharacterized protein n=1 Tax=Rhododendron molle TaxID=49168 RepID=A0ACC0M7K0_RHOML|nr:hypothetical protein RHMOL_Rhmol10G0302400 [Rhododendron molle]
MVLIHGLSRTLPWWQSTHQLKSLHRISATDFLVNKELAALSGIDFAYADNTAVYHTKVIISIPLEFFYPCTFVVLGTSSSGLFTNSTWVILPTCFADSEIMKTAQGLNFFKSELLFRYLGIYMLERFYNFYPNWERGSASLSVSHEIEVLSPTRGVLFPAQHLGENMLAFLLHTAASSRIPNDKAIAADQKAGQDTAVYFDIG